ncbi:MAG TPA: hypothetical protein VJ692_00635, partial [Nitrospiraceae bacterium]|nr:hypothetical protein [Nitrospiraceae bacterium]
MDEASASTHDQAGLRRLIEAAIRAPSGDNCQPWSFQIEGPRRIVIRTVPERAKSFFDYKSCATFLSMGAVIENMRIQAASEGGSIRVSSENDGEGCPRAVSVQLVPDTNDRVSPDRVEAMFQRTVNRRPFLPRPVPASTLAQLTADPVAQTRVRMITERSEIG